MSRCGRNCHLFLSDPVTEREHESGAVSILLRRRHRTQLRPRASASLSADLNAGNDEDAFQTMITCTRPMLGTLIALGLSCLPGLGAAGSTVVPATNAVQYADGRPAARLRLEAQDAGVVLRHGEGPERCDELGARDVWVWESGGCSPGILGRGLIILVILLARTPSAINSLYQTPKPA